MGGISLFTMVNGNNLQCKLKVDIYLNVYSGNKCCGRVCQTN
jgi:hypothetical protein